MDNQVWEWLAKSGLDAYVSNRRFHGPDSVEAGPSWCFERYGQSITLLPDGREVLVGGEHEDFYDPDFYIYNDVAVRHPNGRMEFFGYPREVFPPTDFHSATLTGNRIILIGNLGYPESRSPGTTQVLSLNLDTFEMETIQTSGTPPGWISEHKAVLSADGRFIQVSGGQLLRSEPNLPLVENIDDWRLDLSTGTWDRSTERRWTRWAIRRADGESNHLFGYFLATMERDLGGRIGHSTPGELESKLGIPPKLDLFPQLFRPSIAHEVVPEDEDEFRIHRIRVAGVMVRYVEDSKWLQLTVEGELPAETIQALVTDLSEKLSALENAPVERIQL